MPPTWVALVVVPAILVAGDVAPTTNRWDVPCRVGENRDFFSYASVFRDSTVPTGLPSDVSLRCLLSALSLPTPPLSPKTSPLLRPLPGDPLHSQPRCGDRVCSVSRPAWLLKTNAGPPPHTARAPGLSALKALGSSSTRSGRDWHYLRRPRLAISVRYRRTSSLFRKPSRRRRRPTNFSRERCVW